MHTNKFGLFLLFFPMWMQVLLDALSKRNVKIKVKAEITKN